MTRLFDILVALTGIAVFMPVFCLVSVLILLEDGMPVFFRQPRLGKNRATFEILKFRTMRDGEVTRVGRLLRRTGIDETLQFLNVLRGDMSMVGPRPLTAEDVARLGWCDEECDDRWNTKPGITGPAQIFAGRSARVSLYLDRRYARKRGLISDLKLIAISFAMNICGKNRVRGWLRRGRR